MIWVRLRHIPRSFVCKRRTGPAKTGRWKAPSCRMSSGSSLSVPGACYPPQRRRSWWLPLNMGLWHNFALRKQYKLTGTLFSYIYIHKWEVHANTIYTAINLTICFFFLHVKISPFSFFTQLTIPKVSKFVCYIAFFVGNNFLMIYNKTIGTVQLQYHFCRKGHH